MHRFIIYAQKSSFTHRYGDVLTVSPRICSAMPAAIWARCGQGGQPSGCMFLRAALATAFPGINVCIYALIKERVVFLSPLLKKEGKSQTGGAEAETETPTSLHAYIYTSLPRSCASREEKISLRLIHRLSTEARRRGMPKANGIPESA